MTILNASISAWVALLIVTAETALVLYFAFVIHRNDEMNKLKVARFVERDEAWREKWEQEHAQVANLREDLLGAVTALQKANVENKSLDEDNACMAEANAGIAKERDEWMRLYNELLTTYHDAQGDAHATVPLQEVAPAPVKRTTRKKAGAQ